MLTSITAILFGLKSSAFYRIIFKADAAMKQMGRQSLLQRFFLINLSLLPLMFVSFPWVYMTLAMIYFYETKDDPQNRFSGIQKFLLLCAQTLSVFITPLFRRTEKTDRPSGRVNLISRRYVNYFTFIKNSCPKILYEGIDGLTNFIGGIYNRLESWLFNIADLLHLHRITALITEHAQTIIYLGMMIYSYRLLSSDLFLLLCSHFICSALFYLNAWGVFPDRTAKLINKIERIIIKYFHVTYAACFLLIYSAIFYSLLLVPLVCGIFLLCVFEKQILMAMCYFHLGSLRYAPNPSQITTRIIKTSLKPGVFNIDLPKDRSKRVDYWIDKFCDEYLNLTASSIIKSEGAVSWDCPLYPTQVIEGHYNEKNIDKRSIVSRFTNIIRSLDGKAVEMVVESAIEDKRSYIDCHEEPLRKQSDNCPRILLLRQAERLCAANHFTEEEHNNYLRSLSIILDDYDKAPQKNKLKVLSNLIALSYTCPTGMTTNINALALTTDMNTAKVYQYYRWVYANWVYANHATMAPTANRPFSYGPYNTLLKSITHKPINVPLPNDLPWEYYDSVYYSAAHAYVDPYNASAQKVLPLVEGSILVNWITGENLALSAYYERPFSELFDETVIKQQYELFYMGKLSDESASKFLDASLLKIFQKQNKNFTADDLIDIQTGVMRKVLLRDVANYQHNARFFDTAQQLGSDEEGQREHIKKSGFSCYVSSMLRSCNRHLKQRCLYSFVVPFVLLDLLDKKIINCVDENFQIVSSPLRSEHQQKNSWLHMLIIAPLKAIFELVKNAVLLIFDLTIIWPVHLIVKCGNLYYMAFPPVKINTDNKVDKVTSNDIKIGTKLSNRRSEFHIQQSHSGYSPQ